MMTLNEVRIILGHCKFNDWRLTAELRNEEIFIQVRCDDDRCNVTGELMAWSGRKWFISSHATKSEVVTTAFKAVLTAIEHETREQFTYKGVSIFDPHYDVEKLVTLRSRTDALETRT